VAQAAQGAGAVTVPGGVQETQRCGTEGRGQWARGLNWMVLEVFSNLHDTMILLQPHSQRSEKAPSAWLRRSFEFSLSGW